MSTRRRGVPTARSGHPAFTLFDEMAASPTEPMPRPFLVARLKDAQAHFEEMVGGHPAILHWVTIATIGNVIEVMFELGMIQDPGGLLQDAQHALITCADRAREHDVAPRLVDTEIAAIETMIEAYADIMAAMPHRDFIHAVRETNKRVRAKKRPGDYDANPRKKKT